MSDKLQQVKQIMLYTYQKQAAAANSHQLTADSAGVHVYIEHRYIDR